MQRMLEIMGLSSQVLLALDLEQTYWRTYRNTVLLRVLKNFLMILDVGILTWLQTDCPNTI